MKIENIPFNKEILAFKQKGSFTINFFNKSLTNIPNSNITEFEQILFRTKPHKRTIVIDNYDYAVELICDEQINTIKDFKYPLKQNLYIKVPELLFLINFIKIKKECKYNDSVCVFGIKNNEIKQINFLNLFSNGDVCLINKKFNSVKKIIDYFWQSTFNYSLSNNTEFVLGKTVNLQDFIFDNSNKKT